MSYFKYLVPIVFILSATFLKASDYWEKVGTDNDTYTKIFEAPNGYLWLGSWHSGLLVSKDDGITWESMNNSIFTNASIQDISHDTNGNIYASVTYFGTGSPGIYKTTNNGETWEKVFSGSVNVIKFLNDTIALIATETDGIYYGNAKEDNWQKINSQYNFQYTTAIGINSKGKIFIASDSKIYCSNNPIASWNQIGGAGMSDIYIYSIAFDKSDNIFIGTLGSGMYCSMDDGITWQQCEPAKDKNFKDLLITSNGIIFGGTDGDYTYISSDNGATWRQEKTGLTSVYANVTNSFAYHNGRIFAATNRGVFRTVDQVSDINDILANNSFNLYPNPTNTAIEIKTNDIIPDNPVYLFIYNSTGKLILMNTSDLYSGVIELSTRDLASDKYFIKIRYNNKVYLGTFIVTR